MEQESAQELLDRQSHEPVLVAVGGVAPAEGHVAVGESDQPAVGYGDAMYERRSKNRPQSAARAVLCGGVKVVHRRNLVP